MIRICDITFSLVGMVLLSPLLLVLYLIGIFDTGDPIFRQPRIGQYKNLFTIKKFRSMDREALSVATHLADFSKITRYGVFLRTTKLDELPQLWNVFVGEMSIVGPRPCLTTQFELIKLRESLGVFSVKPGITGLAQLRGVNMSTPEEVSRLDAEMISKFNLKIYLWCICQTLLAVLKR